jgi:hypothetical protein
MKIIYLLMTSLLLSACSSMVQVQQPQAGKADTTARTAAGQEKGWWSVRFPITWPEGAEVSWYMDAFLAHKIMKPVLDQYRKDIDLWRFHRRAARDGAGHQFSFIFYSEPAVAEAIYKAIRGDRQVRQVQAMGLIKEVSYQNTATNKQPLIENTSDKSWSLPVQRSWPYFIMGVSEMWLRLIDELVQQDIAKVSFSNYQDVLSFYAGIEKKVDDTWRDEGGHALLHHLNALFGYQDTIVTERRLMRF